MIVGIIAGGLSGYVFGHEMEAVAWIGELFLRMLKMVIVPLIVASMVVGVSMVGAAVVDRLAMPHEERKEAQLEPAMAMSNRISEQEWWG